MASDRRSRKKKTLLELIEDVDKYDHSQASGAHKLTTSSIPFDFDFNALYKLMLPADGRPHGHVFPSTVSVLPWSSCADMAVDHEERTITVTCEATAAAVTATLQALVDHIVDKDITGITKHRHSEAFRICGARYGGAWATMERYAVPLFGVSARGAHLTCFVRDDAAPHGIRIWVAKRAQHLVTYPCLWDTTVAGGVKAAHTPLDCAATEAREEACIAECEVRQRAWCSSIVTYMNGRRDRAGGWYRATPSVVYCFDMELRRDETPRPGDDEVERFALWTVDEVVDMMRDGKFKPNSNLVMIDFLVRWGVITPETDGYVELVTRLRRRLSVPMD